MKIYEPIYNPKKTFLENFNEGPFGDFGDGKVFVNEGELKYKFLGKNVFLPFGIGAGPIPNSRFVTAAWNKGFDIITLKSVRTDEYPVHSTPNILPILNSKIGEKEMVDGVVEANEYSENLTVANSFGIPSLSPEIWKEETIKTLALKKEGQILISAFQGTDNGQGFDAYIEDHIKGVKMLLECGAEIIEINLSCPNEGGRKLVCFNIEDSEKILRAVKAISGKTPILVKIAYFKDKNLLEKFVERVGPFVDGIVAINTLGIPVKKQDGTQAFPGVGRESAGVSGYPIKWAGVEMVKELFKFRLKYNQTFSIVGVGGVQGIEDYLEYIEAGADAVLSVAGAMWNPYLAQEIKQFVNKK